MSDVSEGKIRDTWALDRYTLAVHTWNAASGGENFMAAHEEMLAARAEIAALLEEGRKDRERVERYERAILWALGGGESDFDEALQRESQMGGRGTSSGRYWWRKKLSELAALDKAMQSHD